jgi:hypothetical protein
MRRISLALLAVLATYSLSFAQSATPAEARKPKWALQYFYDQDKTELHISDFAFPSEKRGVAVGTIFDTADRKKPQHVALITNDGGAKWDQVSLRDAPRSIFFLNDSLGWLVTEEGIWTTQESGRTWTRISDQIKPNRKLEASPSGGLILRIWFLDEQHGFAIGFQKSVFSTEDGGRTWKPVPEASQPESNPAFTVYSRIAFANARRGLIIGGYFPKRSSDDLLGRITPQINARGRIVPTLTLQLATATGGSNWVTSTAPLFGAVASLRLAGANGLVVFNYGDSFDWPTEVYRLTLRTGGSETAFRQKDRKVTDTILFEDAGASTPSVQAYIAAMEPGGTLKNTPIPGRVHILTSLDFKTWTEMDVDYRAVASSILLAGPDADHLWAATDTGMILRLTK